MTVVQVLRPFIITKDAVQRQVYGLGYPSLPTVSVDQFYQQRVDQGLFPDPAAYVSSLDLPPPATRAPLLPLICQSIVFHVILLFFLSVLGCCMVTNAVNACGPLVRCILSKTCPLIIVSDSVDH